jgi:hypothetical protein
LIIEHRRTDAFLVGEKRRRIKMKISFDITPEEADEFLCAFADGEPLTPPIAYDYANHSSRMFMFPAISPQEFRNNFRKELKKMEKQ